MRCVKRILVKDFRDYSISKLVDVLSIVDNFIITLTVGELQDILNKTDTLRENNLYLNSFEHFVEVMLNLINHFLEKFEQTTSKIIRSYAPQVYSQLNKFVNL